MAKDNWTKEECIEFLQRHGYVVLEEYKVEELKEQNEAYEDAIWKIEHNLENAYEEYEEEAGVEELCDTIYNIVEDLHG